MELKELCERSGDIAREEKDKSGRPVLGTLCSYVPVELIHSFGILPLRLWGQADDVQESDTLLQPYICPPVRHLMALGLEGRYALLDGIVHSYTCDATCGLFNIWVRNLRPRFSHLISLPYMAIAASLAYARAEMESFIAALESFTGREFSAAELGRSLALYDRARSHIAEAYRLKARGVPLSYADIHYMNLGLQVLPVETALPRLEESLEAARRLEAEVSGEGAAGKHRILLSGSVVFDTGLVAYVEEVGGTIVADDTCLGYRLVGDTSARAGGGAEGDSAGGMDNNHSKDPLDGLIGYYLARSPCASRADFPARRRYLLEVLEGFGIDAVVFVHQKFCDPHLSDHPFLKEVLAVTGVPSLQLELEGESFNSQVRTRIDGFFETLEAG
ncbi:MAG: 2-hydroxyacyl-CoA dehydratase [Actinobacteria bacterium]|nr:MAG: 2-hydroxyacyl-CoA dehydratase [Actinomycetota bacterium]